MISPVATSPTQPDPTPRDEGPRPAYPYYWTRFGPDGERTVPGQDLAALRRGIGRGPMEAPEMWRFYCRIDDRGTVSPALRAEHAALGLFGVHQQSQLRLMHWQGVPLGQALRVLRDSGRYSEAALDRRVTQAATANDLEEMVHHLRGLVTMLKSVPTPQGLDYSRLVNDLIAWQHPDRVGRVRRDWGRHYFHPTTPSDRSAGSRQPTSTTAPSKEI